MVKPNRLWFCLTLAVFFFLFLPFFSQALAEADLKDDVEIINFSYVPQQPRAGETVEISGAVRNKGSLILQIEVAFLAADEKIHSTILNLRPGERRDIVYTWQATKSVPSIELSVERAESISDDEAEIDAEKGRGSISAGGQWEGETSLTAEDIKRLKNWPDSLMEWIDKMWTNFTNWLKSLFNWGESNAKNNN